MIRLIIIIILFLLSLLAIFKAPAYFLWLMAIAVTEFPVIFVVGTMVMLATGVWVTKYKVTGTVIGIVALILFLSPIIRAYMISKDLKKQFASALDPTEAKMTDSRAFDLDKLFKFSYSDTINSHPLTYATYKDTTLTMDFFAARASGKRPCVIVVHGGSWSSGDSKQLPDLNSYLANAGYNVAAINYRLAPRHQTPAPVEDIKNALIYLRKNAEPLNIDTNNFVLLGRSAGSQIALLAAYTLHDKDLKGVIDFYGPVDMVWGYSIPSNPLIMDSRKVMGDYVGGTYAQVPDKYVACSPVMFVDSTSVPTLIIHGTNDVLVSDEHSRKLNVKLNENNVKHFWLKLPWATHGFDYNLNGPGGQLSTYCVEQFLTVVTD